jgi:hypothetical protein
MVVVKPERKSKMKIRFRNVLPEIAIVVAIAITTLWAVNAIAFERQSNRGNGVRVDAEPVQLTPGQPARFKIKMSTHSVELSQDLKAVSSLKDEQGRTYRAEKWDGSEPGGHHRSGVLSFSELGDNPGTVTLVINDVAGVPARTFAWPVK